MTVAVKFDLEVDHILTIHLKKYISVDDQLNVLKRWMWSKSNQITFEQQISVP